VFSSKRSLIMVGFFFALSGGLATGSIHEPFANAWGEDGSSCHQSGIAAGLSRTQIQRLCRATDLGAGPISCFNKARTSAGLMTEESIQLCRCSQTASPADCVKSSMQKLKIGRTEAILSCSDLSRKSIEERQCLGDDTIPG
jgi:hypothetical protein